VDYNRAGVPLVECVSEPDIRTPEEARAYLTELRATLEALGVSDVRMEEGSLRCDANISTRVRGETTFGKRVEVKNLNSIRSLERALRFEEDRQRAALDRGETITQETRHFDEEHGSTHTLRSKEEAFDYRYFPEPDLPPLAPDRPWVDEIRDTLPELPAARRERYRTAFGLGADQADILVRSRDLYELFEEVSEKTLTGVTHRMTANWVTQNVVGVANEHGMSIADFRHQAAAIAGVIGLVSAGTVSPTAGKQVLDEVVRTGKTPEQVVDEHGLRQVSDTSSLEAWVDEAIAENPGPVEQYRGGKDGALNAVLGAVMKKSRGSADAKAVRELLVDRLPRD
jgi:aspartyl-tRNA(Asn)/glutamyl-tRNA(Gln) amidotransferase subunit B